MKRLPSHKLQNTFQTTNYETPQIQSHNITVHRMWESQHCRVIFSTWVGGEVEMARARAPHFPADLESPVDFMLMVGRCARAHDRQESGGRWTDGRTDGRAPLQLFISDAARPLVVHSVTPGVLAARTDTAWLQ